MCAARIDTKGLDNILKALKDSGKPRIRVGILGSHATAKHQSEDGKEGLTNAEIGAIHEYGTDTMPVRSFLRVPLSNHFHKNLVDSGAFTKEAFEKVVASGTLEPWLAKAAQVAENTVTEAFDTGGYGEWPPSDMSQKKNHQTLVETQQLRNSITAVVVKGAE